MRISDLTEGSAKTDFAMPRPHRDITVAMSRVRKNPNLKIVQVSKFGGYSAVDLSDPRPAVKPNLDRIAEIRRLGAEIRELESYRRKKYPGNLWHDKEAQKASYALGDQIRDLTKQLLKLREAPAHIVD